MKRILAAACFALLLTFATCSRADIVYVDSDGDSVRVMDSLPCRFEIIEGRVPQGNRGNYVAAEITADGKTYRGCAALGTVKGQKGLQVHVIVEGLGEDVFPFGAFEPAPDRPTI
jgi:hypothetical protein